MRTSPLFLLALILILAGISYAPSPAMAAPDDDLSASGLIFRVDAVQDGLFGIAAAPPGTEAVRYALDTRTVSFRLMDTALDGFDNPVFCFDYAETQATQLKLMVRNASDQIVLDHVGLVSALQYVLGNGEVGFVPANSVRCFFYGGDTEASFGLFGEPPPIGDGDEPPPVGDGVFADSFETSPRISVRFEDVPESVSVGGSMAYRLVIENAGDSNFEALSFQEVFPGNRNVFPAALAGGEWACTGSACPAPAGTGAIRFEGAFLPVQESIVFDIVRPVESLGTDGGSIPLYAAAISGPEATAVFDVDRAETAVIGAPTRLVFTSDGSSVEIGQTKVLVIEIQDANGNRVTTDNRFINLAKVLASGSGVVDPMSGLVQVSNGLVNLPVVGVTAGTLTLAASTTSGDPSPLALGTTSFSVVAAP